MSEFFNCNNDDWRKKNTKKTLKANVACVQIQILVKSKNTVFHWIPKLWRYLKHKTNQVTTVLSKRKNSINNIRSSFKVIKYVGYASRDKWIM